MALKSKKLTPLQHKMILLLQVVSYFNENFEKYTAKQVLNEFNTVLTKHEYNEVAERTFERYGELLRNLEVMELYHHKHYNGSKVYYHLPYPLKQCVSILKESFKQKTLDNFKKEKYTYF